jgi:long-chain acyl-CoA synthetase
VNCSREFVARVLGQTEPRLALATRKLAAVLREFEIPTLEFETLDLPERMPVALPTVGPDTLAEIIFTSGTTGDPKGVMLSHRNVAANVDSILAAIPLPRDARMLSLLPLSHMFEQVGGCFCPLAVGAAIRYPSSRQPSALAATMREWKPTALAGVPQLLSAVMAGIEREATARGRMALLEKLRTVALRLPRGVRRTLFRPVLARLGGALDFVISGGAPVDPDLQRKWEAMGVNVLEGYGATECSPVITSNQLGRGRIGSVGRALPGQEVRLAPDGEVLTRGRNVFVGYWRNDTATAAAFDGEWYRTGDLGHFDGDGFLHLKGRKKDLIVLADGQNVYPDDVETVLRRQAGIADTVVVGLPQHGSVRVHAALIEAEPGAATAAVRAANGDLDARQQVMDFTIWPDADFPRTHTLKVRRPLVLAFLQEQQLTASAPPAGRDDSDPLLSLIAQACQPDRTITDGSALGDDLGLDSLTRIELLSTIEEELGVYVDDTEIGPQTTVGTLRALVQQRDARPRARRFPEWSRRAPATWVRRAVMSRLTAPAVRTLYDIEVIGLERLRDLQQPCLVIANHVLHLDAAVLVCSLPASLRDRLAIAAAANDIFGDKRRAFLAALLGNAFPFSKDGSGVRDSLEYLARTLEEGWSVLIFPEGELTVHGPMQPFKSGAGLLAVEARVPVLPLRIDVLREGSVDRGRWLPPRRGRLRLSVGTPLRLPADMPYDEATARLEAAVRDA